MQGKTIAIIVVSIVIIVGIGTFNAINTNEPVSVNNIQNDTYNWKDDCITLTARQLYEKKTFEIVDPTNTPVGSKPSSYIPTEFQPNEWEVFEENSGYGDNEEAISHDPPPLYKQSAQIFTVGAVGPIVDIKVTCIKIRLSYISKGFGDIYCELRTIVENNHQNIPSESILGSTSLYDDGSQGAGKEYWDFTFTPPVLLKGGQSYCFVIKIPDKNLDKSVQTGDDIYSGGYYLSTKDGGKNWLVHSKRDLYGWIIYGSATGQVTPKEDKSAANSFESEFKGWNLYEENSEYGSDEEIISRDPLPEYIQSAQTFTVGAVGPNEDFYATCIKIRLSYFSAGSGEINCDIRTTAGRDPQFFPSKTNLGTASLFDDGNQESGKEYWNFTFNPPVLLNRGQLYSFVVKIPSKNLVKSIRYGEDSYPGGYRCWTQDGGNNWITYFDSDLYDWSIYGYTYVDETPKKEKPTIYSLYSDLTDGDCIIIYDTISSINHDLENDYTSVCFSWFKYKNVKENAYYYFEGDITNKFKQGDVVEIPLHILHLELESSDTKYNIDVFDEQWAGKQHFLDKVQYDLIEDGLMPMSPQNIHYRRSS